MNIGNFGLSPRSSRGGTLCRIVGPVSGNGNLGQNYLLSLAIVYSLVLSDLQRKRAIILSYIPVAITSADGIGVLKTISSSSSKNKGGALSSAPLTN